MAWLVLTGSLTWMRSRESVLPPLWDQQTYVQKAEAVWTSISKGTGENPLNLEPSVRPPGTVILTAPQGPLKDFRNFYFRSAFVPVVIMALSVFIAGMGVTRQPWETVLLALLAASMPMFWQFEPGGPHYFWGFHYFWGLVDTFQASVSALAMASLIVAAVNFNRVWIFPALVALPLLPLIKPSGLLFGAIVSLAWFAVAARYSCLHRRGHVRGWIGIVGTGVTIILVLGGVAFASFNTNYLSPSNIEFGKVALSELRADWLDVPVSSGFVSLFSASVGFPVLIAVAVLGVMAFLSRLNGKEIPFASKAQWMAGIAMVVITFGVAICYHQTLFRQPRYFFPVIAIATILLVPILVLWIKRVGRLAYVSLAIIPVTLLVFLSSQKFNRLALDIGNYSLATGYGRDEVNAANAFVERFRVANVRPPILFTTSDGLGSYAFETAFITRLSKLGFSKVEVNKSVTRPFNWQAGGVVSINSIYNADVLVIDLLKPRHSSIKPMTYDEELNTWRAWLVLSPSLGFTEVVSKASNFIVLAVKDRASLARQMRAFMASRPWRPKFIAANKPSEYSQDEVSKLNLGRLLIAEPVNFGNAVSVHALSMSTMPGENRVDVDVFSESLDKNSRYLYVFFIHQLDSSGQIISNHGVILPSTRFADRPVSRSRYSFLRLPKTAQLGVGVYKSGGSALVTDWALAKDWGGTRAKINILDLPVPIDSQDIP